MRCPGQDPMFWKPDDVFEISCPKCGYRVEFFKFDVKRKCRCGHEIVNPKINFGCAEEILKIEGGHPLVVLGAAYLHDIGIKQAEEKYGSASAEDQEKIGPDIARDILNRLNVQRGIVEEICDIIGHHHHPRKDETLHFKILYEADWLVNMEENGLLKNPEKLQEIIEKNFKTITGKKLANEFFTQA